VRGGARDRALIVINGRQTPFILSVSIMTTYPGIDLSIDQLVFALAKAVTTDDGYLGR